MNKIVLQHVPVTDLPEHLRKGIASNASVRLTIEPDGEIVPPTKEPFDLEALFAKSKPTFSSLEEIADHVRSLRERWD